MAEEKADKKSILSTRELNSGLVKTRGLKGLLTSQSFPSMR